MADTIFGSGSDQWVCPNDRQLALRAKLQTGWSVHTYQTEKQRKSQCLSPAEVEAILQVIQRAERLDILEQQRIGRLVERLETMRHGVLGNGLSQCLLCGEVLGFLGSSSVFCKDCRKWCPATVTVTLISALPAWRTDFQLLGPGTQKETNPGGNQVAAWSPPRWGPPTHPATSQGARAAWPVRPGREQQTHRWGPHPGQTQRALNPPKSQNREGPGILLKAEVQDGCENRISWKKWLDPRSLLPAQMAHACLPFSGPGGRQI
ncbi:rab effector Noc2 isoform X6 [Phacochoerus africanus]|uniref:rab effector Noc2 isoform X6 n=1 Tax=Phacochoerus africanus TaxID=41426 RepID=UPI001FD9495B|nr:rab effector Noc2 isoform X6 [Phacochoerus africanus]